MKVYAGIDSEVSVTAWAGYMDKPLHNGEGPIVSTLNDGALELLREQLEYLKGLKHFALVLNNDISRRVVATYGILAQGAARDAILPKRCNLIITRHGNLLVITNKETAIETTRFITGKAMLAALGAHNENAPVLNIGFIMNITRDKGLELDMLLDEIEAFNIDTDSPLAHLALRAITE